MDYDLEIAKAIQLSLDQKATAPQKQDPETVKAMDYLGSEATDLTVKDNSMLADELWTLAEDNIGPLIYCHTSLHVRATIADTDVDFLIDTGAQTNVLSIDLVKKLGLETFVDGRVKAKMTGIGSTETLGIIPFIDIKFGDLACPVNFSVIDNKEIAILGMPFMLYYKVDLDFSGRKMKIVSKTVDLIVRES